jgi:hypothetical protein
MKKALVQFLDNKRTIYVPDYIYLMWNLVDNISCDNSSFDEAYLFIENYFINRCESIFKREYLIPTGFFNLTKTQKENGVLIYFCAEL